MDSLRGWFSHFFSFRIQVLILSALTMEKNKIPF